MNILITGGSGFIGSALVSRLSALNHQVTILTRNVSKTSRLFGKEKNIEYCTILDQISSNTKIDYIINLAGARISAFPWTSKRRQRLIKSRINITNSLISLIHRLKIKPKKLITASAIGWYGLECNNLQIDETYINTDSSFSHILCREWEKSANKAAEYGLEVDILRLGIVLGSKGGMLKNLYKFYKYGIGFYIGDGKQQISWIHIKDVVNGITFLLDQNTKHGKSFIYNFTSPFSVTNKEFSTNLAKVLHRPLLFRIPKFAVKLFMGKMGRELLLSDVSAVPKNLLNAGYQFKYNTLSDALENIYPS